MTPKKPRLGMSVSDDRTSVLASMTRRKTKLGMTAYDDGISVLGFAILRGK